MKNIHKLLTTLLFYLSMGGLFAQSFDLQFVEITNDATIGGNYDVLVQWRGSTSFQIEYADLDFSFNTAGLSAPTLLTAHNFSDGNYNPMVVSEVSPGITRVAINHNTATRSSISLSPIWQDVATIRFTIVNLNESTNFVYSTTGTVVSRNSGSGGVMTQGTFFPLNSPLPVELSSFTATTTLIGVEISWRTESEIENLGFVLERKTDDTEWAEIASYKSDDALLGQGTVSSATDYKFVDVLVQQGFAYEYRLSDIDYDGVITSHATRSVNIEKEPIPSIVENFNVMAYPNPFNPVTTIRYSIKSNNTDVAIAIYDITGNLVKTLVHKQQTSGWYEVQWNGTNQIGSKVPGGVYLSRVVVGNQVKTNKLILLK